MGNYNGEELLVSDSGSGIFQLLKAVLDASVSDIIISHGQPEICSGRAI